MSRSVMKPVLSSSALYLCLALTPVVLNPSFDAHLGSLHAAENGVSAKDKKRNPPTMRSKIYEDITKAQKRVEDGQPAEAVKAFNALIERTGKKALNSYELAMVYRSLSVIAYDAGDLPGAVAHLKTLLAQPELPLGLEQSMRYFLAQLYFSQEAYDQVITTLHSWFELVDQPSMQSYLMLAQAHLQRKEYDQSLGNIDKVFAMAKEKGKDEKEAWHQIRLYIYSEKEQLKAQLGVLEVLVDKWPKKAYWLNLAGVYAELDRPLDQMHTLELAYQQGMLERESELVALAQMLSSNGMPYKAAKIMDKGLKAEQIEASAKNLERQGEYWRLSQETEKALPVLAKAAKLAEEGSPSLRLAYLYFAQDKYTEAADAARSALAKGELKKPYEARLLLAQSLFYIQQFDEARVAFNQVLKETKPVPMDKTKAAKTTEKPKPIPEYRAAGQWLRYMESEIKRQKDIQEYLNS